VLQEDAEETPGIGVVVDVSHADSLRHVVLAAPWWRSL
jgi:hypothetical protein